MAGAILKCSTLDPLTVAYYDVDAKSALTVKAPIRMGQKQCSMSNIISEETTDYMQFSREVQTKTKIAALPMLSEIATLDVITSAMNRSLDEIYLTHNEEKEKYFRGIVYPSMSLFYGSSSPKTVTRDLLDRVYNDLGPAFKVNTSRLLLELQQTHLDADAMCILERNISKYKEVFV